ncbi:MAG TPA: hypothetical protein VIJ14_02455 [Rhabdochlamydiaceae bacterium]
MAIPAKVRAQTFIDSLAHTPSNQVKQKKISSFITALEHVYTTAKTKETIAYVFSDAYKGTKYEAGMKLFQARFIDTFAKDGLISGDDQKYLADLTQRVVNGQLKAIIEKK